MVLTQSIEKVESGLQYLSKSQEPRESRSPNQELLPLTASVNSKNHLEIGGCDVTDLVEKFGSPLYILDEETLRATSRQYREAFKRYYPGESQVIYASKAWSCLAVCAIAASEGLGIDVVSAGEIKTALKAGVNPEKIYFHGNNKSREEIELAVTSGCTIIADNLWDLDNLAELAKLGVSHKAGERIRVMVRFTPGIECHTHDYIKTGQIDSKFGFDPNSLKDVFIYLSKQPSLSCVGLHAHIGSQIFEVKPHHDLADVIVKAFKAAIGHGLKPTEINIGGGLGIRYTESDDPPSIDDWAKTVCDAMVAACKNHDLTTLPKLLCEPGRSLVGSACVTAYTVGAKKVIPGIRTYLSVDGGMSDNPRPITYQSVYRVLAANKMSAELTETVTVAGKHCESGDILIKDAKLPECQSGDILVVTATGAYNYSMASNYNRVPRPAAVLVKDGKVDTIVERETDEDLLRFDRLPERLGTKK
ncbi:MAG: diaminopimelate decarboxylase [Microcoleus sp. PH2017_29_MFU_D_A]|jgi:diaminopimelate decarboxylase|uniref:diaminopimelate decarboxylase n=1 Tax=unclassified Microcoleus TaxID=2642155 RepID=UPI001DA6B3C1|nr:MULTISPECIES: diaminopimelate decarboxylase [unclassified Microcoleus]MCC3421421.1 diaminopimelate decarboxylase [Microcoleus sp. PH2017_07_MST_O_A]MCC3432764.1 diaminopimelate decarboxylase [Microcoleus sp. PH2017_04_SCI_O_A]MCC3508468.1 diaminopimelate decarboxylase [Microcoleus sp. PH2017_17_BER_D_A]TAE52427.1 MAG: diaminopimelate decarboxylase [Oscillatoriales cyanobacterium]MCC3424004.1 diaminopimelate decarboxylase [Microcoleus sp. PH2017_01_SCD_O_A]